MDIAERVREFITEELLIGDPAPLDHGTPLIEGLLDSGALMRLVVFLEEEFDIEVGDSDVVPKNFENIRAMERFVATKRDALASS